MVEIYDQIYKMKYKIDCREYDWNFRSKLSSKPKPTTKLKQKPKLKPMPSSVHIFYHIAQFAKWKDVVLDQSVHICDSGLIERADKIHIGVVGNKYDDNFDFLPIDFLDKCEFKFFGPFNLYEFPTLNMVHKHCINNNSYVLYIHTKGVSKRREILNRWRKYMMYYCVGKWRDSIEKLKTYDVCGVQIHNINRFKNKGLSGNGKFAAGNFWWSKSEYIRTLLDTSTSNRYEAEIWVGRNDPKWFQMRHIKLSSLGGDNWRDLLI